MTVPLVESEVERTVSAAETVTVCEISPTSSAASTLRTSPIERATPLTPNCLKPCASTLTLYLPIRRGGVRYSPCSSVRRTVFAAVSALVTVTEAPAIADHRASVTVPRMTASVDCCANERAPKSNATILTATILCFFNTTTSCIGTLRAAVTDYSAYKPLLQLGLRYKG